MTKMLRSDVVIATIHEHIPSLSDSDEAEIIKLTGNVLFNEGDVADLALRTCRCGAPIDGFYGYVDHLTAVFGGTSYFGG
jgi:hypothetical protein